MKRVIWKSQNKAKPEDLIEFKSYVHVTKRDKFGNQKNPIQTIGMDLDRDCCTAKLLSSNTTPVKPKEQEKDIKYGELKTFNRFSILQIEESHV